MFLFAVALISLFRLNASHWQLFGGDSSHTAYKDIQLLTNGDGPLLLWSEVLSSESLTYATVINDRYYTISGTNDHYMNNHTLYILNATDGTTIDSFHVGKGKWTGPPIIAHNEQVIINMIGHGGPGHLLYVDSYSINNSYEFLWETSGGAQNPEYPYGATPSETYDIVYFAAGHYNGMIHAVNLTNGRQIFNLSIWTSYGPDWWAPTIYKDRLFMNAGRGENAGYLAEINSKTGEMLWTKHLPLHNFDDWQGYSTYWVPSITNNISVVRSSGGNDIYAIDINNQSFLWSDTNPCLRQNIFKAGSFKDYTAATDGKSTFITCRDGVKSFDLFNGMLLTNYTSLGCTGQPIITQDCVIVNCVGGVKIFNKNTAEIIDILNATGMIALDENRLYVTNKDDGTVKAYLLDIQMTTTTTYKPSSSPTAHPTPSPETTGNPSLQSTETIETTTSSLPKASNSFVWLILLIIGVAMFIFIIAMIIIKWSKIKKQIKDGQGQGKGEGFTNELIN